MPFDVSTQENRLLDVLDRLLARAKAAGADAADALIYESISLGASYRMGKLEDMERSENGDCGLRVFVGKRQAIVSSTDLRDRAIDELAERAVDMARIAPEDPFCGLADESELAKSWKTPDLYDTEEPGTDILVERARTAEGAALALEGITNSEGAGAGWGRSTVAFATSAGFRGAYSQTRSSLSCAAIAGEGADMQVDYDGISKTHASDLPNPEEIGRTAAERALAALKPRRVKSQAVPILFDRRLASSLVGNFARAISGTAIARGTSFLKSRMGDQIFSGGVTIVDDPLRRRGLRSHPFDGEGLAPGLLKPVENGVLTTWILDTTTARQLKLKSNARASRGTGGPPHPSISNMHLEPGPLSPDELMADIKQGLLITSMFGANVSLVTGDYSVGVAGQWIEDGKPQYPVNEITVAGNLKDMFRALTPANDLEFRGGVNAPSVRIEGMTVAGT